MFRDDESLATLKERAAVAALRLAEATEWFARGNRERRYDAWCADRAAGLPGARR